jgi:cell division protein FtsB
MIILVSLLLALAMVIVMLLVGKLRKNKQSNDLYISSLKRQYQASKDEFHSLKEENEILEEELQIIKDIYRNRLLKIYNEREEVA